MKLKFFLVILLVLCLVFIGGISFATDSFVDTVKNDKGDSFILWNWGTAQPYEDLWNKLKTQYPEVDFPEAEFKAFKGEGDMITALVSAFNAGQGMPDVIQFNGNAVKTYASYGILEDLTEFIHPELKNFPESIIDGYKFKNKIYGIPVAVNASYLIYRRDLFDEAGIEPESLKTWDDFYEIGKTLTKDGQYMTYINSNAPLYRGMVAQFAKGYFNSQGEPILTSDPEVYTGLTEIDSWIKGGIVDFADSWSPEWFRALDQGKYAVIVQDGANWMWPILKENCPESAGKWGIMPLPTFKDLGGASSYNQGGGAAVTISKNSDNLELAKKYVSFVAMNKNEMLEWVKDRYVYEPHAQLYLDNSEEYLGGIQPAKWAHDNLFPEMSVFDFTSVDSQVEALLNLEFSNAYAGRQTIEEAIEKVEKEIEKKGIKPEEKQ